MQNFKDLYLELCELLNTKVAAIKWLDLWNNQVDFLEEEYQFPAPAVFLSFRFLDTTDFGTLAQNVSLQVDAYVFYETFANTFKGSFNQDTALEFLDLLNNVYAAIHGTSGTNYSNMRRTGLSALDTGGAGNLYQLNFECELIDYAAIKNFVDADVDEVTVNNESAPEQEPETGENFYLVN
ncbi:MAG: hypothetical protein IE931_03415 [Sphingobacteriales bacterium]|nr:hypothetical protein [Sphingobacteriales bacterium]